MILYWVDHLDFVLLVYGLSFLLLGLSALFMIRDLYDVRMAWRWLVRFGILQGLSGWCDMIALSYHEATILGLVRTVLLAGSFFCLFEFGRRNVRWSDGGRLRRWVYIPVAILVLSGAPYGPLGVVAMICYGVAFPGALLSALALWQWSRPFGSGKIPFRRKFLVCAMSVYAGLAGLLPVAVAIGPAAVVNADQFLALTRIPLQLVCSLWAGIVAVVFWQDYFTWRASRFSESTVRQMLLVEKISVWVVLGLLSGSWIITEGMERKCLDNRDSLLLSQGRLIALSINPERIQGLMAPSGIQAPQYHEQLTEQLQRVCDEFPDIRYLYLMRRGEGGVRFLLDIEPRKWLSLIHI